MDIRDLEPADAEAFLALCLALDNESQFMMLEPDERATTATDMRADIQRVVEATNSTVLVAEDSGDLVGYAAAYGGEFRRNRHSAYIVAGVRQQAAGRGIGRQLFEALIFWARGNDVSRLELTVMVHNERAIRLYSSLGFQVEGTRTRSMMVDGEPVDELSMALLL